MKTLSTQLSYFLQNKEIKQNLPILLKYVGALVAVIVVFTVIFHFIMLYAEGEEHSWITGLYWTLTVMSTLGFGDITFQSDIGRLFSVIVLITGIVMLLIVLPFAFIRFFTRRGWRLRSARARLEPFRQTLRDTSCSPLATQSRLD